MAFACTSWMYLQDGDIEGATTQVEHQDGLAGLAVKAVGERCGRGLVDDAQHVQTGDLASILGGLQVDTHDTGNGDTNSL